MSHYVRCYNCGEPDSMDVDTGVHLRYDGTVCPDVKDKAIDQLRNQLAEARNRLKCDYPDCDGSGSHSVLTKQHGLTNIPCPRACGEEASVFPEHVVRQAVSKVIYDVTPEWVDCEAAIDRVMRLIREAMKDKQ